MKEKFKLETLLRKDEFGQLAPLHAKTPLQRRRILREFSVWCHLNSKMAYVSVLLTWVKISPPLGTLSRGRLAPEGLQTGWGLRCFRKTDVEMTDQNILCVGEVFHIVKREAVFIEIF